jgi:signal peptidase II
MNGFGVRLAAWLWGPYSRLGLSVALVTCAIDQAHKWWMLLVYRIEEGQRIAVLPFLDLYYIKNLGISYGMFSQDGPAGQRLLAAFAFLASFAMTVWLAQGATNRLMAVSLGLIIGGAVGNAIDRLLIGGVADFFSLHAFGFYWYVFNIADVAIVAGVVGLLYESFWTSRNDASKSL